MTLWTQQRWVTGQQAFVCCTVLPVSECHCHAGRCMQGLIAVSTCSRAPLETISCCCIQVGGLALPHSFLAIMGGRMRCGRWGGCQR